MQMQEMRKFENVVTRFDDVTRWPLPKVSRAKMAALAAIAV